MKINYVTTNPGKVNSLQRELPDSAELVQIQIALPEPRSWSVREIALQKAIYAFKQLKEPLVVSDAGFFIDSLNGFPATFVNFTLETIGLAGILKLVNGEKKRMFFQGMLGIYRRKNR